MTSFPMKAFCGGLVLLTLATASGRGQENKGTGKGIDAETVAAYEKLGAVYGGWVKLYSYTYFKVGSEHAQKGLPGFQFPTFPSSKLPEVAVPFGLDLSNSNVTDAGLKELAGLRTTGQNPSGPG